MTLHLYSFFHLNLAFSSIEEEQRPEVIRRCYWPLLQLIRSLEIPVGIEVSGYTLTTIATLDPAWIEELKTLCKAGLVEFIGSGYAQLIGPLVPAAVNHANQRIGLEVYEVILGFRPQLVLVNEQAYSAGLGPIYRAAGYRAMIMEWDNPASSHPEWNVEWVYHPQYACDPVGSEFPVIWNKSIPFQKFQRYAHGEIELPEYLSFLVSRVGSENRTFALYGNDVEIFDFRPGRFHTEMPMGTESEWARISLLYQEIIADGRFVLIRPTAVLAFLQGPHAGNQLHLESAEQPVPVKKQAKYNIMRWAVSGRDDLGLNSACCELCKALEGSHDAREEDWKELCYLWSSDFRTHITARRWQAVQERLTILRQRLASRAWVATSSSGTYNSSPQTALFDTLTPALSLSEREENSTPSITGCLLDPHEVFKIRQERGFLTIDTPLQRLRLNLRKGLAVDAWWDKAASGQPLIGTLPHGYFDDIHYGADFYTGHFVLEVPGQHKITDLSTVTPTWRIDGDRLRIHAEIETTLGPVHKEIVVEGGAAEFEQSHHFFWPGCPNGTLRLGHITLKPDAFARSDLFYRTHNGGDAAELFLLNNKPVNHLEPVSTLVSASHGLGVTEGMIELGDSDRVISIMVDKTSTAVTGHIVYTPVGDQYFFRVIFSAMEMDDTACHVQARESFSDRIVRWRLSSRKERTLESGGRLKMKGEHS